MNFRMYFFVPYNLSDIQKGIQAGHVAEQYAHLYGNSDEYQRYIKYCKTWVILNGGTTRDFDDGNGIGTMNQIHDSLVENEIRFASFREPDLNGALTALCFLASERVYDRETYPNFPEYIVRVGSTDNVSTISHYSALELRQLFSKEYLRWAVYDVMGGMKNVFLRNLITGKSLA